MAHLTSHAQKTSDSAPITAASSQDFLKEHAPKELLSGKNELVRRAFEIAFMAFNFATAMLIIFVNKRLLLPREKGGHGFEKLASTLTCWHYIFTTSVLSIAGCTGLLVPKHFPREQWRLRWFLIIIIAVSPLASNYSLLFNTVATYQLWKIVQTPVVAVMERIYEGRRLTWERTAALTGILGGIALAEVSNVQFSVAGVITAVIALLAAASYKVTTAKLVKAGWHPLQLMHDLFPYATLLLFLFTLAMDRHVILAHMRDSEASFGARAIMEFMLSGFLAFLVTWTQYLVVGTTSALTHSLLAQGKTACAIIGGAVLFGQQFHLKQLAGATLAMASFVAYSLLSVAKAGGPSSSAVPLSRLQRAADEPADHRAGTSRGDSG